MVLTAQVQEATGSNAVTSSVQLTAKALPQCRWTE